MMMGWGLGQLRPCTLGGEPWAGPSIIGAPTLLTNSVVGPTSPYSFTHDNSGDALLVLVSIKGSSAVGGGDALTMTATFNDVDCPQVASNHPNLHTNNPTCRAYLLQTGADQGEHTVAVAFASAQAPVCASIVAYSIDATVGVGTTPLEFQTTNDIALLSQAMTLDSEDSLTVGIIGVLGADTAPFVQGAGYTLDHQGATGGSGSADIGYLAQHRKRGALFDATWAVADNTGAVAVELLPVV